MCACCKRRKAEIPVRGIDSSSMVVTTKGRRRKTRRNQTRKQEKKLKKTHTPSTNGTWATATENNFLFCVGVRDRRRE